MSPPLPESPDRMTLREAWEAFKRDSITDMGNLDGDLLVARIDACIAALSHQPKTDEAWRAWRAALSSRAGLPVPAWIPVSERLPSIDQPCFVAWDGSNAYKTPQMNRVTCARGDNGEDGWLWYEVDWGDYCEWDTDEVPTHWMPLPKLPSAIPSSLQSGHHPDPAIDFCVEVEEIEAEVADLAAGLAPTMDLPKRIEAALTFRVGGDKAAIQAKAALRALASPPSPQPDPSTAERQAPGNPAVHPAEATNEGREIRTADYENLGHDELCAVLAASGPLGKEASDRIAYLFAQEDLLEIAQQEAAHLRAQLDEVKRPLEAQMATLNRRVIALTSAATAVINAGSQDQALQAVRALNTIVRTA